MANVAEWTDLLKSIYNKENAICPECGGVVQGDIYSNDHRVGFAILQCNSCKEHVKLSRLLIPEGIQVKSF